MWRLIYSAGLALTMLLFSTASATADQIYSATVTKVVDGDTIQVMRKDGRKAIIRLYGIDAPDKGQAFSRISRDHLRRKLRGRAVSIESLYEDQPHRTVALVWLDISGLVNESMVNEGLAWHYPHYCKKQPLCNRIKGKEQVARKEKRGLWKDRKKPVPPWEWRR